MRGVLVVAVVAAVVAYEGGGEREGRKEAPMLGVLEREVDESIRRTAGAR